MLLLFRKNYGVCATCEVYSILKDLANYEYDPEEYKKRVRERRGWLMDEREDE